MDRIDMENPNPNTKVAPRLPWHQPQVKRLTVSLDTRDGQGSTQDSYAFTGDPI